MKSKKGIIFALDGAIAISVVFIMLISTSYYFATTSQDSLSQAQVIKRGYDVVAMYDEAGRLDRALRNVNFIDDYISEELPDGLLVSDYLPNGYNMTIELYDATKTPCLGGCDIGGSNLQDTGDITLEPLINGGDVYIQANVKSSILRSVEPSLSILFNNIYYPMTNVCDEMETCTYTTKERIPYMGIGPIVEKIKVSTDDTLDEFSVIWVKVLDDPAYKMEIERDIPTNQFLGGGERWYAAFDENGHFEGAHKATFKVWIEGDLQ